MQEQQPIQELVSHLFRQQAGKMTAALVNLFSFNNIQVAEDIVQDTFLAACQKWHFEIPPNPAAWLMLVAKNKAINVIRKDSKIINIPGTVFKTDFDSGVSTHIEQVFSEKEIGDSQLRLLFMCCHPDIPVKNQVIITLHIHSGFSIGEIANAMLMNTEAVKKNLYRTKQTIKEQKLFYNTNYHLLSSRRIETVHKVLYLMFNEGYKTTENKELINKSLCYESMRLCKLLLGLNSEQSATHALLALMFFNIARFPARIDEKGNIVTLGEQNREQWDRNFIAEGFYFLEQSRKANILSRYHLLAGISAVHCTAKDYSDTDWERIIYYYDKLLAIEDNPIINLNRAIAISYKNGPQEGLKALESIEEQEGYYLYYAAKGDMFFKLHNYNHAGNCFERAATLTKSQSEKKFLQTQIQKCNFHLSN